MKITNPLMLVLFVALAVLASELIWWRFIGVMVVATAIGVCAYRRLGERHPR